MGIQYRRRIPTGKRTWLNVSRSGVSVSHRRGRVTANTRGNVFVRLGRGFFYRKHL